MSRTNNPYRIVDRGPNTDPERRFAIYRRADGHSVGYWPTYAAAHADMSALRCGNALLALEASGVPIHDFDDVELIECESCHRMVPLEECCTEEVVECDDCGHARMWSEGRSAAASYAHEVNAERLRGIADDARQAAKDGSL